MTTEAGAIHYVPNIYFAKPGDYQKATQRIWHTPQQVSYIGLPVR
ncbi:hypothetical protein ABFU84_10900 [Xanthomonas translucens pv. undulosa]